MTTENGKLRLLKATRLLMLKKGFHATSIDEICELANITKGSLFYHFKDKEALGCAAVALHMQLGKEMMMNAPFVKKKDPLKKLLSYVDFIIKATDNPIEEGCLLGTFSQELGTSNNSILNACKESFLVWQNLLQQMIEDAGSAYKPNATLDSKGMALQFLATFEGAIMLAKANQDCSIVKTSLTHYKKYLRSYFE